MCIRDRGGFVRLFQLVILFGQLFHIHLAVREFSGQLASGGVELFQFRFMLCLVPVSYTHLDVYKRQAFFLHHQPSNEYPAEVSQGTLYTELSLRPPPLLNPLRSADQAECFRAERY